MIIFIIPIVITFIYTLISSLTDLKYNIIPNKIVFSLWILGLLINLMFTLILNNLFFILSSIISTTITFLICYILWKIRLWAGGDVKLITGISSIIPINYFYYNELFTNKYLFIPFSFNLIVNSILISFPFIIIYTLLIKINKIDKNNILDKIKWELLLFNLKSSINNFSTLLISIDNLKEGMILDRYLLNNKDYFLIKQTISLESDSNLSLTKSKNGLILKSKSCSGLTNEDILVLKLLNDNNIIGKNIFIKISIPFAPSICIGYLITLLYGNLLFYFI